MDFEKYLPNYKLIKSLQKTATAETILMQYEDSQRVVKLTYTQNLDEHAKHLFNQEAVLLKQLKHPNIIELIDYFTTPNHLVLITNYANSGDLQQFINKQVRLNQKVKPVQIFSFIGQICASLSYLKQNKIIHRDIKPANIFLDKIDKKLIVKIGDFGVSKILDATVNAQTVVGTLQYISPELALQQKYSYETDAWALGVTLYELIEWKTPFDDVNLKCKLDRIIRGDFTPLNCDVKEFEVIVNGLLKVVPKERLTVQQIGEAGNVKKVMDMLGIYNNQ
ncbi:Kinase, NEK [Spironucleus salmonicida]|uniref:non-specific serine/threonine protein kinase n=1 Tax=Spironucleus salmonicida TaxID=348837 RepID=V6LRX2_9EUKA|nr:Kinase, NEK [Spironucleus salmonicida]|eukprot:EST47008.1 Kinase, NEK [Spironucleus salmonicida]